MVNRRGRWYVVGLDTDRGEERVFRLSRIDGPVSFTGPRARSRCRPGPTSGPRSRAWDSETHRRGPAMLRVRAGAGHGLRRQRGGHPGRGRARLGHWSRCRYSDTGWWSEHIASFGADVVVMEPADLREAVIGRLKGVLA